MPSWQQKKRAQKKVSNQKYYSKNRTSILQAKQKAYISRSSPTKAYSNEYHKLHKTRRNAASIQYYASHKNDMKASFGKHYQANKDRIKAARSVYYASHRSKEIEADRVRRLRNAKAVLKRVRRYYAKNRQQICGEIRWRYELSEPKPLVKHQYTLNLNKILMTGADTLKLLVKAFQDQHHQNVGNEMSRSTLKRAASSIAAKRVISKALQIRKQYAGALLKALRSIKKMVLTDKSDFGEGLHSVHSEPYFYESAYQFVDRPHSMSVDEHGRYRPANEVCSESVPRTWKCSDKCKPLLDSEVSAVLNFKLGFEEPMRDVRKLLDNCNTCPHPCYTKAVLTPLDAQDSDIVHYSAVPLRGHSSLCYTGNECKSMLRILRVASTHHPALHSFLRAVYSAMQCHRATADLDMALSQGDFKHLVRECGFDSYESIFSNSVVTTHELSDSVVCDSALRKPGLEKQLQIQHAKVITMYEKQVSDYPKHVCCSCRVLFKRSYVTRVNFADDLGPVWSRLKKFIAHRDSQAENKTLLMCNYCKPKIRAGNVPPRCVLNGLETPPIPEELAKLDCLSRQFIQRAKAYQTVVRLGTYTHKVPMYNSLKACKGNMFFLPLPLAATLDTLKEVEKLDVALPDPSLYVIVNGKPTTSGIVWRSLVNIDDIKAAVDKLKEINWLYKSVDESSLDSAAQQVIEVVNKASSKMLVKATSSDISEFQCYTIRNLNNKLSTESDIEQFKLLSVTEDPLNSRQQHLDVMCFPVLFPDGHFGKFHPREVKLTHSEYIKSRLWNVDSRFRKDPQYVFYLMWQKELREITAGIYNLLRCTSSVPVSVSNLMQKVNTGNEELESHLSTMFQTVRGSNQYWSLRRSELQCIVREAGPPTLFVTFSCSEYHSADISDYLRMVNDVSDSYDLGRLCTEDPVSVSRQFSLKFHAFFNTVIVRGEVLGVVDHFYWKKEYQSRGAPHYHALLWIRGAPVIGVDEPDKVLAWMAERITCHIPNKESDPDLHEMVTRYQMHKCSNYCKRKCKRGKIFITRCKFGFPRASCEKAQIHCVEEKLKKKEKIYALERRESEVRVNDYNPLLLMLWRANMDIQFVSESSLALAHYVSGYVTKAERSHMQDIWDEIADTKSVYSRLFKLGLRVLRSRECGLYEASDLLLGDHLCEKSDAVMYVKVQMPHKRPRRLKDHNELVQLEADDPDSDDIFMHNLISDYYPGRPKSLEDVCLHDFAANYDWYQKDSSGKRTYRKLTKPRLINHQIFDPEMEDKRQDYFYSLILLFVPFRDENSLLLDNETPEQAFQRLLPDNEDCSAYHSRLQKMLKAKTTVKKITEARAANLAQEPKNKEEEDLQLLGEAKLAMKDLCDMDAKSANNFTLEERVRMLNADQSKVYKKVNEHLLHQKRHEDKQCSCQLTPLRMFISGVGGTGKSFLIEAIKAMTCDLWPEEELTCAIAAPTGLAAFNVGGVTIHKLFQMPIEHEGKEAGYWSLRKDAQKVMKITLKNLRVLVIDEVSMVSSLNLTYIHMRMEELFGGNDWFGGKNVLFVGDLLQLQPVNGNPVFQKVSKQAICNKLGCGTSVNIWKDCVLYDELTINERQKSDGGYSTLLDSVRRGQISEDVVATLSERVIGSTITETFRKLQHSGKTLVCLLPTRKQCDKVNEEMLGLLESEKHTICCTDEVDETCSLSKWQEKAAKQLEILNKDCNNTAGLEAVIHLAVGARVMLRRNIAVKEGLVNGAIGTVLYISPVRVIVQFDHLPQPRDIERVKGKFMVLKNYYVYRTQFPLMLAYAVTIHKCQGLSLDSAIVDISERVFAEGMAYVALSRVRSLAGLHICAFSPKSIRVHIDSLKEINRLRRLHRKDLPVYDVPAKVAPTKRKLTGSCDTEPPPKMVRVAESKTKMLSHKKDNIVVDMPPQQRVVWPFKFYSVGEEWQHHTCTRLGLMYKKHNGVDSGTPDLPLTRPNMRKYRSIVGDGNCMFRSLSHIVTGSQDQHEQMRASIVQHMRDIAPFMLPHIKSHSDYSGCGTVEQYLEFSKIARSGTWGTDLELLAFAHLSGTSVYSYDITNNNWAVYAPYHVDRSLPRDRVAKSVYLRHPPGHYDVVVSTVKAPKQTRRSSAPRRVATEWSYYRYHPVDEHWQRTACAILGVNFVRYNGAHAGGPNVTLTTPNPDTLKSIVGDGNCLFRSFSHIITGSEEQHEAVRAAIVAHLSHIEDYVVSAGGQSSVSAYVANSHMDTPGTWGTDIEILALTHLLNSPIHVYRPDILQYTRYSTQLIDPSLPDDNTQMSMYLNNPPDHFEVVMSCLPNTNAVVICDCV